MSTSFSLREDLSVCISSFQNLIVFFFFHGVSITDQARWREVVCSERQEASISLQRRTSSRLWPHLQPGTYSCQNHWHTRTTRLDAEGFSLVFISFHFVLVRFVLVFASLNRKSWTTLSRRRSSIVRSGQYHMSVAKSSPRSLSLSLSVYLSISLSISLYIYLSIYLFLSFPFPSLFLTPPLSLSPSLSLSFSQQF